MRLLAQSAVVITSMALGLAATLLAQTDPLSTLTDQAQENAKAETKPYEDPLASRRRTQEETRRFESALEQAAARLTDDEVHKAIRKGCDYLLPMVRAMAQNFEPPGNGFTEPPKLSGNQGENVMGGYETAYISAGLAALLEAHRTLQEPSYSPTSKELKPVVNWVCRASTGHTYTSGLQAVALSLLPNIREYRRPLELLSRDIVQGCHPDGAYGYHLGETNGWWDNSNSQYGLLGAWASADAGIEIQLDYWRLQEAHWRATQNASGHWQYKSSNYGVQQGPGLRGRPDSMYNLTVAGLASLYVVTDQLEADAQIDRAIDRGLEAVAADFLVNAPQLADNLYYAYGVQRVGVASGLKYFNRTNWFRTGAAALILNQAPDGSWTYNNNPVLGTAMAVMFLCHGVAPVAFNKWQYGFTNDWQTYRRDDAHLTRWLSKNTERPLNWQLIPRETPVSDWLDAPILLITGKGKDKFTATDTAKLREFIELGGIVFSIAVDDDPEFTAYIRTVAGKTTDDKYEMRILPPDHFIYKLQNAVAGPIGMMGLSNGVREVWIHSPVDLAKSWARYSVAKSEHFAVAQNLYGYATGMSRLKNRLDTTWVEQNNSPAKDQLTLARIDYPGNPDPEPGAWPRFARILFNDTGISLKLTAVKITELDARTAPIAHITGTAKFTLAAGQFKKLQQFLDDGGVLIADAAGGSGGGADAFAQSFTELASRLLPDGGGEALPANHLLFSGVLRGTSSLATPDYRKFTPAKNRAKDRPEIKAWKNGNRIAILFSPVDITAGLLGTPTWGISGYSPEFAPRVARGMLFFAKQEAGQ